MCSLCIVCTLKDPRARGRCVSVRRMHVSAEMSRDSLGTCAEALFFYWEILEFVDGGEGEYASVMILFL